MRRLIVYLVVAAVAVALVFVLRHRKRAFIAAQIALFQSDDLDEATAARKRLQRIGRSAVRPVCALLEHEDEEVRARAAWTLANIGHAAACGPLMAAAKRGDFSAADALARLKHPRADEAMAWAWCEGTNRDVEELQRQLPVGSPLPAYPWPWMISESEEPEPIDPWQWLSFACEEANSSYEMALGLHPMPQAHIGRARLLQLCGHYDDALKAYDRALHLTPDDNAAKVGKASAEELALLAARMARLVPACYRVDRILSDPTWREKATTCYLALITWPPQSVSVLSVAPKLVLFRQRAGRLEKTDVAATYPAEEREEAWVPWGTPTAYAGIVEIGDGGLAEVVVIRGYLPRGRAGYLVLNYDVIVYGIEAGTLERAVSLPSEAIPWVTDLDGDGNVEIITFRHVGSADTAWRPAPYPTVHTHAGGRYVDRSARFPEVFEVVKPILLQREREYPKEPGIPEHLGQAYEILGKKGLAVAAYERADRKYAAKGDRKGAAAVKHRRVRVEAELTESPGA